MVYCFYCHILKSFLAFFFIFLLAPEEGLSSNRNIGQFVEIFIFLFNSFFNSSSPCRNDQFAVSYFSTS